MSKRFELLALLGLAALPVLGFEPENSIAGPTSQAETPEESPGIRLGKAFDEWRAGDDAAGVLAKSIATEMSAMGRVEAPKVLAHYEALTKAERAEGYALEMRVRALREELGAARASGVEGEEWRELQKEIEHDIDSACTASKQMPDLGARAQAFALRAEYRIAQLEGRRGATLAPDHRARLAEEIQKDVSEALACFERFDILRAALNPRWSLARIEYFRGCLEAAKTAYERLAIDALAIQDKEKTAQAYEGLLSIAADRGDEFETERCLGLLAKVQDARTDWALARAWAMRLIHADRAREARDFLEQFKKPQAVENSADAIATRRSIAFVRGEALLRMGELELARSSATESSRADGDDFEQRFLEARIELAAGHAQAAIDRIAVPALLSSLNARDEGAARTLLGGAHLALGHGQAAAAELERALELAEQRRQLALVEPLTPVDEARRFNFIGEREGASLESVALLARARLLQNNPLAAALASEDWQSRSLRGDNDELAVMRARAGMAALYHPLTDRHLDAWAATVELGLVTWTFGADSGAVVHVKRGPSGVLDCAGESISLGREKLREAARRLRECAIDGLDATELARRIRDTLLPESIRGHIGSPKAPTDRLLLLLHGPLEALPVELLGLGDHCFDEELCLLALPGLPSLEPGPRAADGAFDHWRLLGSPVDGAQLDAVPTVLLPGAGAELGELSRLHPGAPIVKGASFQRAELERALLSTDCVHIATHLELKPGEARSRFPAAGLRLNDGDVASAREIANMTPKLPLVVLSACETGGGRYADGEGLFGVARAFLEGGTRNLVVTLWPVEDSAAHDFAVAFHRALKSGMSPSAATRTGRAELRAAHRPTSDWAAFRFTGRD